MITRRGLLGGGLTLAAGAAAAALSLRRSKGEAPGARPVFPFGLQTGDVGLDGAVVWAQSDRPARLRVEWDTTDRFASPRAIAGPVLVPEGDHTGIVMLRDLPPGQTICVRAHLEAQGGRGESSEPAYARFRTPAAPGTEGAAATTRIAWSGDTCGQGWGINLEWGGLRGYAALRKLAPDVFVHCGDLIYADNPIPPEIRLPDGRVWRNIVTPAKSKVAETLAEFRGNFAYNLQDAHVRALAAEVPMVALWDDHEVRNNWYPGQVLTDERYTIERRADVLAARARQAFFEYTPTRRDAGLVIPRRLARGPIDLFAVDLRSHRSANGPNRETEAGPGTDMMGRPQLEALLDGLTRSTATWRVVCCDQPLGLVVPDGGPPGTPHHEGFANGEGPPLGRELELAWLFDRLAERGVGGVVFITADVHYAAAHRYHPPRGPAIHEFVAGPLHAGTFGPNPLDPTFAPEVLFQKAPPPGQVNLGPWDGHQFIGTLDVDGTSRALTARLHDIEGRELYRLELPPPA